MLRSAKSIRGFALTAVDGEIGGCEDFLFDDAKWTIRYMVANTGTWLKKRRVLISPISLGNPDWESGQFLVTLTRSQIEDSPPLDSDAPVSREYERKWSEYYTWSPYWFGGGVWGAGYAPQALAKKQVTDEDLEPIEAPSHNMRSIREVTGYHIRATDGEIGHVEDFIVDDSTWTIRYLVIDTRNLLPGKKVLLPPDWATSIDWSERLVDVDLTRDEVKDGPEYDPTATVNRQYEKQFYDYYGRPSYKI